MANICTNLVYADLKTKANSEYFKKWLDEEFGYEDMDEIEENVFEGIIDSKWSFPNEEFQEFTNNLPDKDEDIYIRSMSYELGCYYHALYIYEGGEWREE